MKAILCSAFCSPEDLVFGEVNGVSEVGDDEVVISVKAAGVNFPDTLIIQGKYQYKPNFPFSPGGEVSGIVKVVGKNVLHVKPGDRVYAGTGWGGFAEEVVAPGSNTFILPEEVSFKTGAVVAEAYGTSYHGLVDRAEIKKGETLLVLGASGGVGIAAVQIGKALGAKVIAAASTDEKLEFCSNNGADLTINYSKEDLKTRVKELTGGKGVDIIYDPVGDPFTEPALRAIAWNGRHLIVGFAAGDIPKIPMNLPLLKGCSLVGVFWGGFFRNEPERNRNNFKDLMQLIVKGRITPPIQEAYSLERAGNALRAIIDRKAKGKLVIDLQHV